VTVYVVSGAPRSGTSMLMRMLAEGGGNILADAQRPADSDNPRGYFELEAVKGTATDTSWTAQANGRIVKVISWLLPHLPSSLEYRVLFMHRNLEQVVRSQRAMLARLAPTLDQSDEDARRALVDHLAEIAIWLESAPHIRILGVSYERVLFEPEPQVARILAFLELDLDASAMVRAIEPALRRQR
jgi:hypothetical protein